MCTALFFGERVEGKSTETLLGMSDTKLLDGNSWVIDDIVDFIGDNQN
jgi:hypothetical protein